MAGRFSFSSPGGRGVDRPWFRVGEVEVTTTLLVAALSVVGMLVWSISNDIWNRLFLWPERVLDGQVWRLVTWPFANEPDIWTVITIAIFWYFARDIEGQLGRNRFAILLGVLAVLPGLLATVLDIPEAGIRPLEFGVFLIFVADHPYARFFFGIPAWVLAAVFVGIEMLQLIGLRESERIIILLFSIALALVMARSMGLAQAVPWIPSVPLPGGLDGTTRRSRRARRPRGGVVAGPWTRNEPAGPAGLRGVPLPPGSPSPSDQAELDDLLDKISAHGMDALSGDEKRRLNELSKRMRGPR